MSACPLRAVACTHCQACTAADNVTAHANVCLMRPLPCAAGCGLQLPRGAMKVHLEHDCPEAEVCCIFAGCNARMRRADKGAHADMALVEHLSGERAARTALERRVRAMERRMLALEAAQRMRLPVGAPPQPARRAAGIPTAPPVAHGFRGAAFLQRPAQQHPSAAAVLVNAFAAATAAAQQRSAAAADAAAAAPHGAAEDEDGDEEESEEEMEMSDDPDSADLAAAIPAAPPPAAPPVQARRGFAPPPAR